MPGGTAGRHRGGHTLRMSIRAWKAQQAGQRCREPTPPRLAHAGWHSTQVTQRTREHGLLPLIHVGRQCSLEQAHWQEEDQPQGRDERVAVAQPAGQPRGASQGGEVVRDDDLDTPHAHRAEHTVRC